MSLCRLDCSVQRYAWGSRTAIPELLGAPADGTPMAELWMGAHPQAPSRTRDGRPLTELVADRPEDLLGEEVVRRYGAELPFLFKVLAAAEPLSIQAHPDAEQARAGFAREEAAGVPRDAPHRSYRDDRHKPELIVAATDFVALKGFRSPEAIAAGLRGAGARSLEPELAALDRGDLEGFTAGLLGLDEERRAAILAELAAGATGSSAEHTWVRRLLERYPGDIGTAAPLILELVELAPGQGLYLPAGELHAYLHGVGYELMASSDNVLRGGLTQKHIDPDELLSILRFEPSPPARLEPRDLGHGWRVYDTPASEFSLAVADVDGTAPERPDRVGVEILLCSRGAVSVRAGPERADLHRGQVLLVPAASSPAILEGRGQVWSAGVGQDR